MTRLIVTFDSRERLLPAIAAARGAGVTVLTALLPAHDDDVARALGIRSHAGVVATIGGAIGGAFGLWFTAWTAEQWPTLMVSGKPLVPWPTFVIIAFELAILGAVLAAVGVFALSVWRSRRVLPGAIDGMTPPTGDPPFALVIARASDIDDAARLMLAHGARECRPL